MLRKYLNVANLKFSIFFLASTNVLRNGMLRDTSELRGTTDLLRRSMIIKFRSVLYMYGILRSSLFFIKILLKCAKKFLASIFCNIAHRVRAINIFLLKVNI